MGSRQRVEKEDQASVGHKVKRNRRKICHLLMPKFDYKFFPSRGNHSCPWLLLDSGKGSERIKGFSQPPLVPPKVQNLNSYICHLPSKLKPSTRQWLRTCSRCPICSESVNVNSLLVHTSSWYWFKFLASKTYTLSESPRLNLSIC